MTVLWGLASWLAIWVAVSVVFAAAWWVYFGSGAVARLAHRLAHRMGKQPVEIVSEWRGDRLWMGTRCLICGEVDKASDVTHILPPRR